MTFAFGFAACGSAGGESGDSGGGSGGGNGGGGSGGNGGGSQPTLTAEIQGDDYELEAQEGSPVSPSALTWALVNTGTLPFEYEVRSSQAWASVGAFASGTVPVDEQTTIQIDMVQPAVEQLAVGTYFAEIEFRNATNSNVLGVREISLVITALAPAVGGWTELLPSTDSRLVYVSSSAGDDSFSGLSEQAPKRTLGAAKGLMRNGFPDWMLLKKGDVWNTEIGNWTTAGRNAQEPQVITSYGSGARPLLRTGGASGITAVGNSTSNWLAIVDLHLVGRDSAPASDPTGIRLLSPAEGILIEGCLIERFFVGIVVQGVGGRFRDVTLRRNVVIDNYTTGTAHAQGAYFSAVDGMLLEENVFDQNGWLPSEPAATGPNIFRHNVYIQTDCSGVVVRGNYFLNASSNGLSLRCGGTAEDNVLSRNPIGLLNSGAGNSVIVRRNIVMEGRDIDGSNPRGWGIEVSDLNQGLVADNLVSNNASGTLPSGIVLAGNTNGPIASITVERNRVHGWRQGFMFNGSTSELVGLRFLDNHVQEDDASAILLRHSNAASVSQIVESGNNRFFRSQGNSNWIQLGGPLTDVADWKSQVSDTTSSEAAQSYPESTRGLASYHASLGREGTHDGFALELRKQSKDNWRAEYTSRVVADWIRAGFGMEVQ